MRNSKHGLRALGLCLFAALGLMAFVAASAQAQTGWLESGAFITTDLAIHAGLHPLKAPDLELHATLDTELAGGTKVQILCGVLTTTEGVLFGTSVALRPLAEGLIKLHYKECKTLLNGVVSAPCKPKEPILALVKFHAILHAKGTPENGDGKTYILFEPDEAGKPFTTLEFGEECAFGTKVPINGDLVAQCLNEKLELNTAGTDYCLDNLVHHLIEEAPHKLFLLEGSGGTKFHELLFGARQALLLGITDVLLSAPGLGNTFAVHI